MDLDFSEEQVMLRDSVRRICENHFDDKAVRSLEADHDKFNRAALLGWRVLRFTSRHLEDGSALADITEALGNQPR